MINRCCMADYVKYHDRIKENLSRFRNFNDPDKDGISPEKVIFSNDDNIYYGTFKGKLNSNSFDDIEVSKSALDNCSIDNSKINDSNVFYSTVSDD